MRATALMLLALAGCDDDPTPKPKPAAICAEEMAGTTSDGDAVTICQKIFADAPMVKLPPDDKTSAVWTVNGVVEIDIGGAAPDNTLVGARLIDRDLTVYELVNPDGTPMNERTPIMIQNHFPSNRVHFLLYEAKGTPAGDTFVLESLKPIVMLTGRALDERFLGAWEGRMSLYTGDAMGNDSWSADQFTPIRLEMHSLTPHENLATVSPIATPPLADGERYKALGGVVNAVKSVKLSTGECIPSLVSLGDRNPLRIAKDFVFTMWRFPAMHTAFSADFHIVTDYPKDLYDVVGMAPEHNFRLQYFISPLTTADELKWVIHGVPFGEMVFYIKPVKGGGEGC